MFDYMAATITWQGSKKKVLVLGLQTKSIDQKKQNHHFDVFDYHLFGIYSPMLFNSYCDYEPASNV